ncbi:tRNA (adenosine(37)-N6)-threonylcarbamoyltransferase complex ATPase subunit type 1 TsaE [Candidatus Saccharibacteria bacterium]|nr:tRNA (adenosine(37)-N6)-threonylcarbamoyltransferase complex ATPase subunit type 1 TsaE [Candidatus Saccharibacteria bacterium]
MTHISSEQTMKAFGQHIGSLLHGGEVIELVGDVGAGKTTFVKGLALGLDIDEDIQSPSFTISRTYDARDDLRLVHYDFYRLDDAGIMKAELQESVNDTGVVTVIEWADIASDVLPNSRLTLQIIPTSETEREVTVSPVGDRAEIIAGTLV